MPVRKPASPPQFDLFTAKPEVPKRPADVPQPPKPANDCPEVPARRNSTQAIYHSHLGADEWWTTRMTCAFLKISRKTLWERRKDQNLDFPKPVQLGGARNLYRASAIRNWAEAMAQEQA